MKTCEAYQELVSAYVDGEINDEETAEVFFHLGSCGECRAFMTSVMKLQTFLQVNEPPAKKNHHGVQLSLWKRKIAVSFPAAAAAVVLTLLSGSLFFVQRAHTPPVVNTTQTEYVYVTSLPPVDVVASPLPQKKTN